MERPFYIAFKSPLKGGGGLCPIDAGGCWSEGGAAPARPMERRKQRKDLLQHGNL